jgi:hypothetical protein
MVDGGRCSVAGHLRAFEECVLVGAERSDGGVGDWDGSGQN